MLDQGLVLVAPCPSLPSVGTGVWGAGARVGVVRFGLPSSALVSEASTAAHGRGRRPSLPPQIRGAKATVPL